MNNLHKQKLSRVITTKPALQEKLKGVQVEMQSGYLVP